MYLTIKKKQFEFHSSLMTKAKQFLRSYIYRVGKKELLQLLMHFLATDRCLVGIFSFSTSNVQSAWKVK